LITTQHFCDDLQAQIGNLTCAQGRGEETLNDFGVSHFHKMISMEYLQDATLTPTKKKWLPRQATRKEDHTLNETQGKPQVE
jgi:hypothetical protein